MKKRIISLACTLAIVFGCISGLIPFLSSAADASENQLLIEGSDIPLKLWYDEEAPKINEHASHPDFDGLEDDGWQQWSLPLGND